MMGGRWVDQPRHGPGPGFHKRRGLPALRPPPHRARCGTVTAVTPSRLFAPPRPSSGHEPLPSAIFSHVFLPFPLLVGHKPLPSVSPYLGHKVLYFLTACVFLTANTSYSPHSQWTTAAPFKLHSALSTAQAFTANALTTPSTDTRGNAPSRAAPLTARGSAGPALHFESAASPPSRDGDVGAIYHTNRREGCRGLRLLRDGGSSPTCLPKLG